VAAADMVAGTVAVLAVLGALARFGTTSLAGLAGAQAVLGPGIGVSPAIGALASGLAGLACVAAAPRDWRGYPFGVLAAVVAFGPAATGMGDGLLRAAGLVLGIGLVVLRNRFVPDVPWWAPVGAAVLALVLAVVA
jgi:hypothetical protein